MAGKPAAIELEIFEDEPDQEGENVSITTDGEFVVIDMTLWEQGLGSFHLAHIKIHHPVAKKICEAGLTIRQQQRAAKRGEVEC